MLAFDTDILAAYLFGLTALLLTKSVVSQRK